ncbi:histidine phosphatase family protein [Pseudonocardia sp. ICBG1293]|uniref:histidine phosphatase family protein n=1 Tax=Pseudonocardia sp. ICBG1293 TaxID=2844382 RepID=UPI001CC99963|nr:histidine phosphatase family protein [Pseudonocardia sp. ICBG1293]
MHYWAAEVVRDHGFTVTDETDDLRWLSREEAAALLTRPTDADLLDRLDRVGPPSSTVVLVRHAKAGSRAAWEGDDDLRPLSGTGFTQADRLAEFLARFGPDRLATAPPLRCSQTIEPYARTNGAGEPDVEPLLGEHGYWVSPATGLRRFRELAAQPGVTLLCSQGGVIPDVVGHLLAATGRSADPDLPSHKASTWVLGFDAAGGLLSADYYRRPPA